eukprot:XP_001692611.1 predicted protein [Chlamydomonas reinhardtii]
MSYGSNMRSELDYDQRAGIWELGVLGKRCLARPGLIAGKYDYLGHDSHATLGKNGGYRPRHPSPHPSRNLQDESEDEEPEAMRAAKQEAERIRAQELGGAVPAVQDESLGDGAEAVAANDVIVLAGETGCGKTTQVRYDRAVGSGTALKFMTDGILLRELQLDFALSAYRHAVSHQNKRLFDSPPPVINVPARQFPVTVHFSRRTEMTDYVSAAFRKEMNGDDPEGDEDEEEARQAKVFAPHPAGSRLIIVATNVAETSLTIPGTSAHFNDTFPDHSPPEIVNTSLEGTVLVMKAMGVDRVHNFPFPTPPEPAALLAAHGCLEALGALVPGSGRLTDIGRAMAAFPISPRHARMLLEVLRWHKSLSAERESEREADRDAGAAAGPLSVPEAEASRRKREAAAALQARFRHPHSDALSALAALVAFEAAGEDEEFAARHYLHGRNLREAADLHKQLLRVARRVRTSEYLKQLGESRRKHHAVRYQPACLPDPADHVFLHPRSALHGSPPELVVYGGLLRTDKRPYMAGLTAIEPEWLTESGTPLCVLSEAPLADPPPAYRGGATDAVVAYREARYGLHGWALPAVAAPHPDAAERAAVFGAALLEGRVLPALADLRSHLAASPAMLLRPELRGVARVGELADQVPVVAAGALQSHQPQQAAAVRHTRQAGLLAADIRAPQGAEVAQVRQQRGALLGDSRLGEYVTVETGDGLAAWAHKLRLTTTAALSGMHLFISDKLGGSKTMTTVKMALLVDATLSLALENLGLYTSMDRAAADESIPALLPDASMPCMFAYAAAGNSVKFFAITSSGGGGSVRMTTISEHLDIGTPFGRIQVVHHILKILQVLVAYAPHVPSILMPLGGVRKEVGPLGNVLRSVTLFPEFVRKSVDLSQQDGSTMDYQGLAPDGKTVVLYLEPVGLPLQRAPPSEADLRRAVRDVLAGVAALHAAGFVHRDIKWQNVIRLPAAAAFTTAASQQPADTYVLIDLEHAAPADFPLDCGQPPPYQLPTWPAAHLLDPATGRYTRQSDLRTAGRASCSWEAWGGVTEAGMARRPVVLEIQCSNTDQQAGAGDGDPLFAAVGLRTVGAGGEGVVYAAAKEPATGGVGRGRR